MSDTDDLKYRRKPIKEYLQNIRNLPSVPSVIYEVSKLLDNPMTSAADLAVLISKDQAMVARILTVANSPFYGLPRRVSTVEFAIVILGFESIKNIVIALSMLEAMKGKSERNWNRKRYWLHSISTAGAAKRISEDLGYTKSGEAFTAGLLHDLGISIIQRYFNREFHQIHELVKKKDMHFLDAEQEILGLTHQEIGFYLADRWNLPLHLNEAILYHHYPSRLSGNKVLISIVHLADYMINKFLVGGLDWDKDFILDESIIDALNLGDINYLNQFTESYRELFSKQIKSIVK